MKTVFKFLFVVFSLAAICTEILSYVTKWDSNLRSQEQIDIFSFIVRGEAIIAFIGLFGFVILTFLAKRRERRGNIEMARIARRLDEAAGTPERFYTDPPRKYHPR